jgi:site-specific recombinase XerD
MLKSLFDQFLVEKQYIQNCSRHTISAYTNAFKAYGRTVGTDSLPTQNDINQFVVGMRKDGLSIRSCNNYLVAFGVFVKWLREAEYEVGEITIKRLKEEKRILPRFTDEEIKKIIKYRPKDFLNKRLRVMVLTLIDTGCRINEVLTLERANVDLNGLYMKVYGKGQKERIVAISPELRREFVLFLRLHPHRLVFCTNWGTKLYYQDAHLSFRRLCLRLGIEPKGFHALRRTFAKNYLKSGGNLIFLKAAMGHSRIETTETYVEVQAEDLKVAHLQTSILSRLR